MALAMRDGSKISSITLTRKTTELTNRDSGIVLNTGMKSLDPCLCTSVENGLAHHLHGRVIPFRWLKSIKLLSSCLSIDSLASLNLLMTGQLRTSLICPLRKHWLISQNLSIDRTSKFMTKLVDRMLTGSQLVEVTPVLYLLGLNMCTLIMQLVPGHPPESSRLLLTLIIWI